MHAELVRAAGDETAAHEARRVAARDHGELRPRALRTGLVRRDDPAPQRDRRAGGAPDPAVEDAIVRDHAAVDDRVVALVEGPGVDRSAQRTRGHGVAGDETESAGLAVESLQRHETFAEAYAEHRDEGARHEGAVRVEGQSRRLVDDEHTARVVHDPHVGRRGRLAQRLPRRDLDAGTQRCAALDASPVDGHTALADRAIPTFARDVSEALREERQEREPRLARAHAATQDELGRAIGLGHRPDATPTVRTVPGPVRHVGE
jgi:hypothetical protein